MSYGPEKAVQPDVLNYGQPLSTGSRINLEQTHAQTLVIHESLAAAQKPITEITKSLAIGSFDRLAFPKPSEKIRDSQLVTDWIEVLEGKHDFSRILIVEPANRYQRSARGILRHLFPELEIIVETVEPEEIERAEVLATHCADLRFQEQFDAMVADIDIPAAERFSLAGSALALCHPQVVEWYRSTIAGNSFKQAHFYNHTDCAITGGLEAHQNFEYDEALHHTRELKKAGKVLRDMQPGLLVVQHVVGVEGVFNMDQLHALLKAEARDKVG